MPSLDPTDVFPQRNLPGPAEPWGREVEKRINELKTSYKITEQELQGLNRALASQFSNLSRQIDRMVETTVLTTSTQSFSNVVGPVWGTEWTASKPSWATQALVASTTISYVSGSMTGGIQGYVFAGTSLFSGDPPSTARTVLGFYIDSGGVSPLEQSPQVVEMIGVDGESLQTLYLRPSSARSSSGSGSVSVLLSATVTWF